jgi:hypothetical protein
MPEAPVDEIYLDIETLRYSDEVPEEWDNVEIFGMSVAVTYDLRHGYRTWFEADAQNLIKELSSCDRIITFNGERFDFRVLSFYGAVQRLYSNSFDLCELVRILHGRRCSLNRLSRDTLHRGKRMFSHPRYKGLGVVELWKVGETGRVTRYCQNDVQLLVDLVSHIRSHGFLVVQGRREELPWNLALRTNEARERPSAPKRFRSKIPNTAQRIDSAENTPRRRGALENALFRLGHGIIHGKHVLRKWLGKLIEPIIRRIRSSQ